MQEKKKNVTPKRAMTFCHVSTGCAHKEYSTNITFYTRITFFNHLTSQMLTYVVYTRW